MVRRARLTTVLRRQHRRDHRGAAAVEFALVSTILFTLTFGIIQYGWYFFSVQTASSHAREVARKLAVGDCWPAGQALAFVKSGAQTDITSVTVFPPPGVSPNPQPDQTYVGNEITVTVQVNGKILGLLPLPNGGQGVRVVRARYEDSISSGSC